jgi:MFS family permease
VTSASPADDAEASISSGFAGRLALRLPFFYGWVIVGICFLTVFLVGTTSFWGMTVFVGPIHDDTGWSNGSILGALALRSIVAAFTGLIAGHFVDRRNGAKVLLLAGVVIDGASMLSLRWVQSPEQFLFMYGVVGGIGNTGQRLLVSTLIPKWFVINRSKAIGMAQVGGSLSALFMVPILALVIDTAGWRDAWVFLAALLALLVAPCVALVVRAPEDIGLKPDNGRVSVSTRARVTAETERSYTLDEAIHSWRLWLLLLAMLFGTYSLSAHTVVMVPWYKEVGFSSAVAASAMSAYGIFSIISRFLWGYIADRITTRYAIVFQSLMTAFGSILLLSIGSQAGMYAAAGYMGLTLSGYPILSSLVWPEFFGRRHIGSIVGTAQFFIAFANAGAQVVAGVLSDRSGTYETTIWLVIGTWVACSVIMLTLRPAREASRVEPVAI